MKKLLFEYKKKKPQIKKRLEDFKKLGNAKDEDIFAELCFCILTPQSKAVYCDKVINKLRKHNLLFNGDQEYISSKLKGFTRFHNKKSEYLIAARRIFQKGRKKINIKNILKKENALNTREWLVKNIKGLGYKEASHFLRNTGQGNDIAILDVHIMKNLKRLGVVRKIPSSISKKTYLKIEDKMRKFSRRINIPLEELDLLFWSNQTGFIFK